MSLSLRQQAVAIGKSDSFFYAMNPKRKKMIKLFGKGSHQHGYIKFQNYTKKIQTDLREILEFFDDSPYSLGMYFISNGYITIANDIKPLTKTLEQKHKEYEALKWASRIKHHIQSTDISYKGVNSMKQIIRLFQKCDRIEPC